MKRRKRISLAAALLALGACDESELSAREQPSQLEQRAGVDGAHLRLGVLYAPSYWSWIQEDGFSNAKALKIDGYVDTLNQKMVDAGLDISFEIVQRFQPAGFAYHGFEPEWNGFNNFNRLKGITDFMAELGEDHELFEQYDILVVLTKEGIVAGGGVSSLVGVARGSSVCDDSKNAALLVTDFDENDVHVSNTLAHEMAHVLGANHLGLNEGCTLSSAGRAMMTPAPPFAVDSFFTLCSTVEMDDHLAECGFEVF